MNPDTGPPDPVDESLRRRFEAAWLKGRPVPIEDCLPAADSPEHLPTLEELVHIELEFAWKADTGTASGIVSPFAEPPTVETYLARFPALDRPEIVQRLAQQEHDVRRRCGERSNAADYSSRFPGIELEAAGEEDDAPPGAKSFMPRQIGSYRIIRLLGEGGMGIVYLAEQEHPRRTVALKVIKPGYATPQMLKRFEHEAQVLGHLHHTGIAQVFEAGIHEGEHGPVPYIAMEHVDGEPLGEFCNRCELGFEARLDLVARICEAVQHAHQKGVIHRDLKPGNILVENGSSPQPKILDFGVARATDADLQTTTLQTDVGQLLGTIQYMSPEQASGKPGDLDMRSDVYALGMILYELLTGQVPYDLRGMLIHEAVRRIREEDPTPAGVIDPSLRGDLTTILGKALEKDKRRRYQTAAELGAEIRRYLGNEPITAHPPSAYYHLRKFARRNKALVIGAVAVVAAILIGSAVSVWQAVQATQARMEAEVQRDEAVRQAEIARMVNAFLNEDLLAAPDPWQYDAGAEIDRNVRVIDVVDRASKKIEGRFPDEPLVEAAIRETLGQTYRSLGDYEPAGVHLERALALRRDALGDADQQTLTTMNYLAILKALQGREAESEELQLEVLEGRTRIFGEEHPATLESMSNLALLYSERGRLDEAIAMSQRTVELSRRLNGEENPSTLIYRNNLASALTLRGRLEEAEKIHLDVLEIRTRLFGEEHADTVQSMTNLARVYTDMGRFEEAEKLHVKAAATSVRVLGESHPYTLETRGGLALLYYWTGRYDEAIALMEDILEIQRRILGEEHKRTLATANNLAALYLKTGRIDEAEVLFKSSIETTRKVTGPEHPDTLSAMSNLAWLYRNQGRDDESLAISLETLEIQRRVLGEDDRTTLITASNLGELYLEMGRIEEAEALLRQVAEGARRAFPSGHEFIGVTLMRHAAALAGLDRPSEAEPLLIEVHRTALKTGPEGADLAIDAALMLAEVYTAWGKTDKAAEWREAAAELRE